MSAFAGEAFLNDYRRIHDLSCFIYRFIISEFLHLRLLSKLIYRTDVMLLCNHYHFDIRLFFLTSVG